MDTKTLSDLTADTRHPLDAATTLAASGPNRWTGHTSKRYWAFIGPFGGATAAALLRAALDHPERIGDPLALTVNYCAPIVEGGFHITARAAKTNRSTQHWTLELFQQEGDVLATATAVFAKRRPGWTHAVTTMPRVPPPDGIKRFPAGITTPWVDQYDMRFAVGTPALGKTPQPEPQSAETILWLRDAIPRPLDHLSLASMSDAFFGRVFHVLGVLVPFGTVSLTTYFHCGADEISSTDGWVLGRATASAFRAGFGDQTAELWSPDGQLLATSVQATYFRDWKPEE
ncbi:thioesterase family protein [Bradyrhizobium prioriisuperbiae]|uniref:acyl-CoA thioesterase n=1 Tax=Bradyrhizobium prioriisuperbiae TaxID=2854389 RepID=UPI0028E9DAC1|nr:thioesterase family protein [Bradyrhizobium prioritasuperba]